MIRKKIFVGALIATSLIAWAAKDPVLMNINGKDVKLSELEYLYQKNNQQQLEKESLDKYVDRFIVYKLKVAEAAAAGIDTTKSFINEFSGYQNDLARPYLTDSTAIKRLAKEAYDRMQKEVDVSHIMIGFGNTINEDDKMKAKADSIRERVLAGESFESLAERYSIDPSAKTNKGHLGYITSGRFPYSFEMEAFNTPKGGISEVFKTNFGYHIIKVQDVRPSRGKVHVEHVMKLIPRNSSDTIKNQKKASIDSIYIALKKGANFEETAKKHSDDLGTARVGGELPWFGTGSMVKEFEDVAFKLNDGEISEPFETAYGYHIVKKLGHKPIESYNEVEKNLIGAISNDERSLIVQKEKIDQLKNKYNYKVNPKVNSYLKGMMEKTGGYDSLFMTRLGSCNYELFTIGKTKYPLSIIKPFLNPTSKLTVDRGVEYVLSKVDNASEVSLMKYEKENLVNEYPDYKNLLNEYKDGMMLYEISNRNVWDKASKDKEGLESYFQANKAKYSTWSEPKFKGTIIYTKNDSLENEVKKALTGMGGDTVATALRKEFKRDIRIDRVLVAKGENAQVDELIFKGAKQLPNDKRFTSYFIYEGKIINQPEEASDVRGQVTSDYQNVLEDQWVNQLKSKYKVKVDKKQLDALRK